ncbi:hypothetical protein NEOLEDRAFT_1080218, partial [Neolentinus lepideus HHB14362 ss-1]
MFELVLGESKVPVIVLHNVLHVPQLGSNLLSVYHLTKTKGYRCVIQDALTSFYLHSKLVFTASVNDRNTGYLNGRTLVSPSQSASLADACPLDLALWHHCLSHVNLHYLQHMKQKQPVQGLVICSSSILDPICEPCITGKQHHHNVRSQWGLSMCPSALLELVVSDLKGPLPVALIEGYRYWITFIDTHT